MQIQARIVSVKRHTLGYIINGEEYTRNEAVKAARRGQISNARIVRSRAYAPHLVGTTMNLYDLPARFSTKRRFANKRSK
jgi:hypothetical protein